KIVLPPKPMQVPTLKQLVQHFIDPGSVKFNGDDSGLPRLSKDKKDYVRTCKNYTNSFCYICGKFNPLKSQRSITELIKYCYEAYFQRPMENLDKWWTPKVCCTTCGSNLTQWYARKGPKMKKMEFYVPVIWREPSDHDTD